MTTQQNEQTAVIEERDEALERAVVELLNVAVILQKDRSCECKMCGWQNDHAPCCPVPALEEWINPTTLD